MIGAGPGGYEAAIYAAKKGAQVTLIEKKQLGGTCLNVGCIPTKALLASAEALETAQQAKEYGILAKNPAADYAAVVARKDKVVAGLQRGIELTLEKNGVTLLRGEGSFYGNNTVLVQNAGEPDRLLEPDAVIIATGSKAAVPPFIPYDGTAILTSDEVLSLTKAPESMLIVGGGVIGCEIGQFLCRMGTKVTVVEMLPHLLPPEDADTAAVLERRFRREKIKAVCGSKIQSVEKTAAGVAATLEDGTVLEAQKMLVATGRSPYTAGLNLAAAGIETGRGGFIGVDENMRTSAPDIYAIGDVVATPQLAHVAVKEGFAAVDAIFGQPSAVRYSAVPRCVYTHPEVASVGVTERELEEKGLKCSVGRFDFMGIGKAKASGKTEGFAKVLVDENDRIIGAAIVGAGATEMLQTLTLAVDLGLTAKAVGDCIFPHPTMSEVVMEALHDVHGNSIHKI